MAHVGMLASALWPLNCLYTWLHVLVCLASFLRSLMTVEYHCTSTKIFLNAYKISLIDTARGRYLGISRSKKTTEETDTHIYAVCCNWI